MSYLIEQIFLSLLAAAAIGAVAGWLACKWTLRRRRSRQAGSEG